MERGRIRQLKQLYSTTNISRMTPSIQRLDAIPGGGGEGAPARRAVDDKALVS